jgi:hypothetical protein
MATKIVPGQIDPDTLPSCPREQIIRMMNEALRGEFHRIEGTLHEAERRSLLTAHDVGKRVHRLRTEQSRYDDRAVALVAAASGVEPTQLYRTARFFEVFPNRKVVEKLMNRRGAGGYRFGWVHVLQLLPVDDADRRAELVEVAFRDRLTVRELADWIHDHHDHKAGRPLRTVMLPPSLFGGLNRLATLATKLRTQFQTTLPECVLPRLAELPAEQINEDVVGRVAQIREELTGLAREAAEGAAEIARMEEVLDRRRAGATENPEPHPPTTATPKPGPRSSPGRRPGPARVRPNSNRPRSGWPGVPHLPR